MSVWIVVVAAGSGARFGGPKQYELLGSSRVVDRSIATACRVADRVALVVAADDVDDDAHAVPLPIPMSSWSPAARPGRRRCAEGSAAVPNDAEVIVVHDAARPLATDALFEQVIAAVAAGADAAVPGVAVSDSLRRLDGGIVDRGGVGRGTDASGVSGRRCCGRAHRDEPDASDDATLVEMIGGKVEVVPGEATNFKITTSHDLVVARMLVAAEGAS